MKTWESSIKTKHPTKGEKGTRWKDPSLGKQKIFLRKHEQIKYLTPSLIARSISDKEKGGTLERTPS
jgi:hypothetical protein